MGRQPDLEGCDWPRSICTQPIIHRVPKGGAFCDEHYKAWALEMQLLLERVSRAG